MILPLLAIGGLITTGAYMLNKQKTLSYTTNDGTKKTVPVTEHLAVGVPPGPPVVPFLDSLRQAGYQVPQFSGLKQTNPTLAEAIQQKGQAVGAAQALYKALKARAAPGLPAPAQPVLDFQNATNSDEAAKILTGPVPATGKYDLATSSALTVYTNDPIPPDASAPAHVNPPVAPGTVPDLSKPGGASLAGSMLYQYLKKNGNKPTPALASFTKTFQIQVNSDPKFPGPASVAPILKIVSVKLKEDGDYGTKTADALAIGTGDRIKPAIGT